MELRASPKAELCQTRLLRFLYWQTPTYSSLAGVLISCIILLYKEISGVLCLFNGLQKSYILGIYMQEKHTQGCADISVPTKPFSRVYNSWFVYKQEPVYDRVLQNALRVDTWQLPLKMLQSSDRNMASGPTLRFACFSEHLALTADYSHLHRTCNKPVYSPTLVCP